LDINLEYCNNATFVPNERALHCKTEQEIQEYILENEIILKFVFVNSFFDGNDFIQSIKYFLDDTFYWPLLSKMSRTNNIFIKLSEVHLSDNLFTNFLNPLIEQFFQVSNYRELVQEQTDSMIWQLTFQYDKEYDIYERVVYTMTDLIQEIGGFQSSLFLFGLFVVGIFSKRLYYASLIKKMYQTDTIKERRYKLMKQEEKLQKKL